MVESGGVYLYLSQEAGEQISVFRVAENGDLTKVQDVAVDGEVMPLVVTPDRHFLLAAIRSKPYATVSFAINGADGTLSQVGRTAAPESALYLSTDHTGRHLMAAYSLNVDGRRSGLVSMQAIGRDGVAQLPPLILRTPPKTHSIVPDPANRFALAASCNGDVIMRYRLDLTAGEMSPDGLAPVTVLPKSGPRHVQFHPNNRFFYLVNEYDGSVIVYRWNAKRGTLHEIQTASATGGEAPADGNWRAADLRFTPDGRYLYASVRHASSIVAFSVDPATGLIAPIGRYPTADEPRSICIDPSRRFLYAAGYNEKKLVAFAIDPETGSLSRTKVYDTVDGPNWLECVRLP